MANGESNVEPVGTRAEFAASMLKSYIFQNGLKPGDRIPSEADLATQLNVSRPTLREAIRGLSLGGLLEAKPRVGTRVRQFDYGQIAQALVAHLYLGEVDLRTILEARAALELAALPLIARRVTSDQILHMREIENQFEKATRGGGKTHVEYDLQLHASLLEASGNQLLASMVGLLRGFFDHPLLEDSIIRRHFDAAEQERTINEHRLLIEALAARDVELATRVLQEHFDRQIRWLDQESTDVQEQDQEGREGLD